MFFTAITKWKVCFILRCLQSTLLFILNTLSPYRLHFPISSKGSFICTGAPTRQHIPQPVMCHNRPTSTGGNGKQNKLQIKPSTHLQQLCYYLLMSNIKVESVAIWLQVVWYLFVIGTFCDSKVVHILIPALTGSKKRSNTRVSIKIHTSNRIVKGHPTRPCELYVFTIMNY